MDLLLDLEDMLMDVLQYEFQMVTEEVFQQFGENCGSSKEEEMSKWSVATCASAKECRRNQRKMSQQRLK